MPEAAYQNPFKELPNPEQFRDLVKNLTKKVVYLEGIGRSPLSAQQVSQELSAVKRIPHWHELEAKTHDLEILEHLFEGLAAHELANQIFTGAWQAALKRASETPETLTRQEVADIFNEFSFKEQLLEAEQKTITHYARAVELLQTLQKNIRVSDNITIDQTDFEGSILDLKNRITERDLDTNTRRAALQQLNEDLADLVRRIPGGQEGKRLEMEEIYLLRRLIQERDNGHLVSVHHGTIRQDLHPASSVDFEIAVAGEVFKYQVKTFKVTSSPDTRKLHADIIEKEEARLEERPTRLAVLDTDTVIATFKRTVTVPTRFSLQNADIYRIIKPLTDRLDTQERAHLLTLLKLTEQDFQIEVDGLARLQEERAKHEATMRAINETHLKEKARFAAMAEEFRRREREENEAEQARQEAILARQEADRIASKAKLEEKTAAERKRQEEIENKLALAAQKDLERKAEAEKIAQEEAKKEAARKKREEKKAEKSNWPPASFVGIAIPANLINFGLLSSDWDGNPQALLKAKKEFFAKFGKAKAKVAGTDADQPNAVFKQAFPTPESLTAPTEADRTRWKTLVL